MCRRSAICRVVAPRCASSATSRSRTVSRPRPARRDGPRRRLFEGRLWLAPAAEGPGNNIAYRRAASVSESHVRPAESLRAACSSARARKNQEVGPCEIGGSQRGAACHLELHLSADGLPRPDVGEQAGVARSGRRARPRLRVLAAFERSRRTVAADSSGLRAKDRLGRAGKAPNGVAVVVSTKTPIPLGRDSAGPERG
jgi:hypothetical protein